MNDRSGRPGPLPRQNPTAAKPRFRKLRFALDAALGAALMVVVHLFVLQVSIVRGSSMEPCLYDGDRLVVDCVSYSVADVRRGDVVILQNPRDPAVDYVKRIVGVPGDLVGMHGGMLEVNGAAFDSYGCIQDRDGFSPFVVPEGHFYVLGDNRPVSCDSREFGLVEKGLLRGRVRARFWPLASAAVF